MNVNSLPLSQPWCMWTSQWKGKPNLQFLTRSDTVQSFWMCFNSKCPTSLPDKSYLHIFREGISPLWEDPQNVGGGHFKLTSHSQECALRMWQSIVLNLIGGSLSTTSDQGVNGVSFVRHTTGNNLIKVWVASSDKAAVERVRTTLVTMLNPSDYVSNKVTFVPHKLVLPSKPRQMCQERSPVIELDAQSVERKSSVASTESQRSSETECLRLAVKETNVPISRGLAQVHLSHDPYSFGEAETRLRLGSTPGYPLGSG